MSVVRLACPACRIRLEAAGHARWTCVSCGRDYLLRDGIYRFLSPDDLASRPGFDRQYAQVRQRDGAQRQPADYRRLPMVSASDPHAGDWGVRRVSFSTLVDLLRDRSPMRVADLGAGNGWLAYRLTRLGHAVVAIDRLDDDYDGLGVHRVYEVDVTWAQADFDRLPLADGAMDVAVLNGSLHYSPDPGRTLAEARRVLAPGGVLVVMDSPMFHDPHDGEAMVADQQRRFGADYGVAAPLRQGVGFLTFDRLRRQALEMGLRDRFIPSRGSLAWQVRRAMARWRLGRAPAAFGVWVAQ